MGGGHHHHHGGGHGGLQTATVAHRRRLVIVLGIYLLIMATEAVGAWLTGSLALLSEALHMGIDGSGILIALIASLLATRRPSSQRTFGLMRVEILAVLINCLLLFGLGAFIVIEAVRRWVNPQDIGGAGVIITAGVGLLGAAISLVILSRGAQESLNVKAAFLEVLSDSIGAAAVIVSGILNLTLGWSQADAIAAVAIGVIILPRAFMLLKQALNIILQGAPEDLDVDEVRTSIENVPDVYAVHSLHVWALTSGVPVLSAHVVLTDEAVEARADARVLDDLTALVREEFNIQHATFQLEEHGHFDHEGAMHRHLDAPKDARQVPEKGNNDEHDGKSVDP